MRIRNPRHVSVGVTTAVATVALGLAGTVHVASPRAAADTDLPVVAVTASAHDGNVPANAIDGNLATRWSAEGDGQWIRFDLGAAVTIGSVRIAWYQGDQRSATFDVQTSTTGSSWQTVHSGRSSGTTTGFESYDLTDGTARYLRVLGHGNSDNAWNSISEVRVAGSSGGPGTPVRHPVTAAIASAHDGNVPANAIDSNLATRWSAEGNPQWLRLQLAATVSVGLVRIAWYRGDERRSTFDVEASVDGSSWSRVFAGTSSGTTAQLESYAVTDSQARYVRVVGHGNSDNAWNSISEVEVWDGGTGVPPTTTPPPAGTDPNGVRQLYPTRAGKAQPWTLGFGSWQGRFGLDGGSASGSGANTVVTNSGQVRMGVQAVAGNTCDGETDQGEALERGYMCSPNDWYNFELTGYVRVTDPASDSGDQDWTWYGGGGRHTGDGPPEGCMGSAYKGSYHYADAQVRFGKESWHVNYDYRPWVDVPDGLDYTENPDRWLGMKYVRYEFTRGGQRGIRNELWLDLDGVGPGGAPANNWRLARVDEDHPDRPSWGENATDCGVPADDQIMLWGGPTVTYRWDNTTSQLRLASAREIVAPAS